MAYTGLWLFVSMPGAGEHSGNRGVHDSIGASVSTTTHLSKPVIMVMMLFVALGCSCERSEQVTGGTLGFKASAIPECGLLSQEFPRISLQPQLAQQGLSLIHRKPSPLCHSRKKKLAFNSQHLESSHLIHVCVCIGFFLVHCRQAGLRFYLRFQRRYPSRCCRKRDRVQLGPGR